MLTHPSYRLFQVPPEIKLPAFYLVDALSKNVFDPYAGLFASIVAPLFLEAYQQVDQQTRGKMEEMLLTWRTGAPNGRELFGVGPQLAIERGIWPSNPGQGVSTVHRVYLATVTNILYASYPILVMHSSRNLKSSAS